MAVTSGPLVRRDAGNYEQVWSGIAASGDTGVDHRAANYPYKNIVVRGTFAGAPTLVIEVSEDGVNYTTAEDDSGAILSFTAAGIATAFLPNQYLRPRASAGAGGAAITVVVVATSRKGAG